MVKSSFSSILPTYRSQWGRSTQGENQPLVAPNAPDGSQASKQTHVPPLPSSASAAATTTTFCSDVATDALLLLRHFVVTLVLMMIAYHFAISVPGVAFIWSLCGSSMGFLLCLAMPAAFYLKVGR